MSSSSYAVDCHLHSHWPQRYPYLHPTGSRVEVSNLSATPAALVATLKGHGITHALLIQPGAYAFDNRAMLDVIAGSKGAIKALAALPLDASDEDFVSLKSRGVVGVRLSLITFDPRLFENENMSAFLTRCRKHDFWVEIFAAAASWPAIIPLLRRSEVKVIVEHLGWPLLSEGVDQLGFKAILDFGRTTNAVSKLSCGFRISWTKEPYPDLDPYIAGLLEAFGSDRCIWGSDWPHLNPDTGPAKRPTKVTVDYGREFGVLRHWVPDENTRSKILWTNPARLFGFTPAHTLGDIETTFAV
jgi:predicted TIM-barrel fold metal-dependent hydrolase